MSLANLIVQPDRAVLVTDSGHFTSDGTISEFHPKVMAIASANVAVACVGSIQLGHIAREMAKDRPNDEWTLGAFLKRIRQLTRNAYQTAGMCPTERWSRVFVAMYDHQGQQARGCTFWTAREGGPVDKMPWTFYPVKVAMNPWLDYDLGLDLTDNAVFDPVADAMTLVELQRQRRTFQGMGEGCFVAGQISVVTVSGDGIEWFNAHEYPDRVGELAGAIAR